MFLAGVEHLVVLLLGRMIMGRESFAIELVCVEFDDGASLGRAHLRILLRLVHVPWLGLRRLRLRNRNNFAGLMPGPPLHRFRNLQWLIGSRHRLRVDHVGLASTILSSFELPLVQLIVLLLQFPHFLNLVQVHDEAGVQVVQVLDALTTEN